MSSREVGIGLGDNLAPSAITRAKVDPYLYRHMPSLDHSTRGRQAIDFFPVDWFGFSQQ